MFAVTHIAGSTIAGSNAAPPRLCSARVGYGLTIERPCRQHRPSFSNGTIMAATTFFSATMPMPPPASSKILGSNAGGRHHSRPHGLLCPGRRAAGRRGSWSRLDGRQNSGDPTPSMAPTVRRSCISSAPEAAAHFSPEATTSAAARLGAAVQAHARSHGASPAERRPALPGHRRLHRRWRWAARFRYSRCGPRQGPITEKLNALIARDAP